MSLPLIVILLFGGLFLFGVELFLPGGVLGTFGAVMLIAGITGVFISHGVGFGLLTLLILIFLVIALFRIGLALFPRSSIGKKLLVMSDGHEWISYDNDLQKLIGKNGVAHTLLRPSGTVIVDGQRYDVVTKGELIQPKTKVVVVEVEGNRIVVEEVPEEQTDNVSEQTKEK